VGCGIWGLGFEVNDLGLSSVKGLGLMVKGLDNRFQGLGFCV